MLSKIYYIKFNRNGSVSVFRMSMDNHGRIHYPNVGLDAIYMRPTNSSLKRLFSVALSMHKPFDTGVLEFNFARHERGIPGFREIMERNRLDE